MAWTWHLGSEEGLEKSREPLEYGAEPVELVCKRLRFTEEEFS